MKKKDNFTVCKKYRIDILALFFLLIISAILKWIFFFRNIHFLYEILKNILVLGAVFVELSGLNEITGARAKVRGFAGALLIVLFVFASLYYELFFKFTLRAGWVKLLFVITGFILTGFSITIRYIAIMTLKTSFSYTIRIVSEQKLVTDGIYGIVRHPAYLGTFLFILGFSMINQFFPGFFCALITLVLILNRIRYEESLLLKHYGDSYLQYQKKTKKFIID